MQKRALRRYCWLWVVVWAWVLVPTSYGQDSNVIRSDNVGNLTLDATFSGGYIADVDLAGNTVAVASPGGIAVYHLDALGNGPVRFLPDTGTEAITLTPGGNLLAAGLSISSQEDANVGIAPPENLSYEPTEGQLFRWHFGQINDLVADDNGYFYVASSHGQIFLLGSTAVEKNLVGHTASVLSLALSPSGRLASGGADGTILLWPQEWGTESQEISPESVLLQVDQPVIGLTWSPVDENILAVLLEDGTIGLIEDGELQSWPVVGTAIAWSPDGSLIAVGTTAGVIELWNPAIPVRETTLSGHSREITTLAWKPEGLVSGAFDGEVRLWDISQATATVIQNAIPCCINAVDSNGNVLIFARNDTTLWRWDMAQSAPDLLLRASDTILSVAISTSETWIAVATTRDLILFQYQSDTGYQEVVRLPSPPSKSIGVLAFRPDEKTIFAGLSSGEMVELDIPTLTQLRFWQISYDARNLLAIDFSPVNEEMAVSGLDGEVNLFQYGEVPDLQFLGTTDYPIVSTQYSPDGQWLASGTTSFARLQFLNPIQPSQRLCQTEETISTHVTFTADSQVLLCANNELQAWSVVDSALLTTFPLEDEARGLILSTDGTLLFIASTNEIQRWKIIRP